ncbi:MAG: ABC transporter ATP-binding protein [Arcobacteraceae bacterium]
MFGIAIKNFGISFGNMEILKEVSFSVKNGEIVTLLGPSGSGKSTILRSIASLEHNFEGEITLNETCSLEKNSKCNKDIGYIFQDYALFPHLDVKENIGFALFNLSSTEKQRRVDELLKQFDLIEHRNKQIHELSGGQQQRVSIARTIAYNPKILLLDEPFSNLDSILRDKTKLWLKDIIKKLGLSAILVTHDKKEALSISDKIGILHNKTLVQFGTPQELFKNPTNLYIAQFLGDVNILPKSITKQLGVEVQEDETAIVRVKESFISYKKSDIELVINQISFCGDYYELSLYFKEEKTFFIKAVVNYDFDFNEEKSIYLNISRENILVVKT